MVAKGNLAHAPGRHKGDPDAIPSGKRVPEERQACRPLPSLRRMNHGPLELTQEAPKLEGQTPITLSMHGLVEEPQSSPAEEEGGTPLPTSGLLQVAERRQPLSSVSSLEVHFDLLDLTELTDMSDQELAEVFADSDEETVAREPAAGLHPHSTPRAGYLRSPSWTRTKAEPGREKKHLSDPELQADPFLAVEKPKEE